MFPFPTGLLRRCNDCMLGLRTLVAASYIVDYRVRQCLSDVST